MKKTDDKAVGRESDKFMLRFPEGMRERITTLAKDNGRSMNAEIIARLEDSLAPHDGVEISEKSLDAIEVRMRHALKHK